MTHRLTIAGWRPATLNQLLQGRWTAQRLKKRDRDRVRVHAQLQAIPPATARRRVDLEITLGPRMKKADPDNCWKSVLDALTKAGLLVDDRQEWCEVGTVDQSKRAAEPATVIILTDL